MFCKNIGDAEAVGASHPDIKTKGSSATLQPGREQEDAETLARVARLHLVEHRAGLMMKSHDDQGKNMTEELSERTTFRKQPAS